MKKTPGLLLLITGLVLLSLSCQALTPSASPCAEETEGFTPVPSGTWNVIVGNDHKATIELKDGFLRIYEEPSHDLFDETPAPSFMIIQAGFTASSDDKSVKKKVDMIVCENTLYMKEELIDQNSPPLDTQDAKLETDFVGLPILYSASLSQLSQYWLEPNTPPGY